MKQTQDEQQKKAVILLSGGMDSATVLAIAQTQGYQCHALSFNYGQRHNAELIAAKNLVNALNVQQHEVIELDLSRFGGSALTDHSIDVPTEASSGIPVTYVPARNTVFLSLALAWAETLQAHHIFIGVNAVDYSGYPDCRPEFINAFETMANLATKAGVESSPFRIHTPLLMMGKAEIIQQGVTLGIDYRQTVTCYVANNKGEACGQCDACRLRIIGFEQAGMTDQTRYY
ncbi:MAG: 7-cyano-7-deazaguanine synthase QueC [Endozoicomonadaceae bacterium]|nr:7-cyano-7-deazaguanine synthase QueC [Endozoicomonadaceae bacterium]